MATHYLNKEKDSVSLISSQGITTLNMALSITPDIEDLVAERKIVGEAEMILKIKKPDYLGESQWEFRYKNRQLIAKIIDNDWLLKFHNRKISIRPQDSILCKVQTTTLYDENGEVLDEKFEITKINPEIIKPENINQLSLLED